MSDKLFFAPLVGYKMTRLGILPAYDNWNNRWQGNMLACANTDRTSPAVRLAAEPMTLQEKRILKHTFNPVANPEMLLTLPSNAVHYLKTGTWDLGELESPLQTICQHRRKNAQETQR